MSPLLRDALAVLGGFLVGLLSGTMGIGGGVLLVPIMVLGFGLAQQVAQGTSLAAIVPTAAAGAYTLDRAGNVDRAAAPWLVLGGTVGALVGSLVAVHLGRELLVRLFGALLLFSAWRLWAARRANVD